MLIYNGQQLKNCEKEVIGELLLAPYGAAASQQNNNVCCGICDKGAQSVKHPAFECGKDENIRDIDDGDGDEFFVADKKTVLSLLEIQKEVYYTTDEKSIFVKCTVKVNFRTLE